MEKWRANRTAGKPSEDEMRLRRADGEYRWCLIRTAPLHDEQRNIVKWYGVSIDIEDSKKLSDALRESEQRYLSLFQNMKEGVAYFRMLFENGKLKDAIYLEVNSAWENLTGLKNVIGRKITEVLPGILETNTEFLEQSSRVALTDESESFDAYSTVLKKWLSTSAYCPQKEHVIVVMDDITERKRAEEALRKSERVLREAESLGHTGSWEHDLVKGEFFNTDENLRLFFGDDRSKGASFEDYTQAIHPDDREFVIQRHAQLLAEGGPREIEYRVVWPDGNVHVLLAVATVVRDESGQAIRTYGTNLDITERKQAEDKLQLAYQSLSYHVENTPLAVIEFDKDLVVKRWSKRAEEIFGWKASEALGKNIYDDDFCIIYKEDLSAVDTINEELTKGIVNWNLSLNRNYTKEGSVIYCEWYNSVLKDERGNVITILSLVHNVTERKRTEEKLRQVNAELRDLSSHLQNIQENERTTIAREIHDELGQQLTGLKMEVGWLTKKLPDDRALKEKGNEILSIVSEMLKTVKRIAMDLRPNILDQLGLIAALEWQGQEFEKSRKIKFHFNTNLNDFNPDKNLSTNIFRVHQEALTNITRHAQATEIETTLEKKNNWLRLMIKDNGKGFDTDGERDNSSFGLIGMKERALLLRGKLVIESTKRKGTVITLKVPLLKKESEV